jgi:hypothetical protein
MPWFQHECLQRDPGKVAPAGPCLSQFVQLHRKLRPRALGESLEITEMSALVIQGAALLTQKDLFGQERFKHALAVFAPKRFTFI